MAGYSGTPLVPIPTVIKPLTKALDRTGPVAGAATLIVLVGGAILARRFIRPGGTRPHAG